MGFGATRVRNDPNTIDRQQLAGQPLCIYWVTDVHYSSHVGEDPATSETAIRGSSNQYHLYAVDDRLARFAAACNIERPDFVLNTGDSNDGLAGDAPTFPAFMAHWDSITIPKALTAGNHDYYTGNHAFVAAALGRGDAPMVAGSAFNQSISLSNGRVSARLILFDSNYTGSGHDADIQGRCPQDTLDWVESELLAAPEDHALIACHHPIHEMAGGFLQAEAEALAAMVASVIGSKPSGYTVRALFGHTHSTKVPRTNYAFGPSFPGHRGPALVDPDPASYTKLRLYEDGSVRFFSVKLPAYDPTA